MSGSICKDTSPQVLSRKPKAEPSNLDMGLLHPHAFFCSGKLYVCAVAIELALPTRLPHADSQNVFCFYEPTFQKVKHIFVFKKINLSKMKYF